jgi:hypothetical protein
MSRLQASAERSTAPWGDGSGTEAGPSPEPAAPTTGLLDVLQLCALAQRLGQDSVYALLLASREASAAVERMATRMVLKTQDAQPDTVALQRLASKLPNVQRLTVNTSKDGSAEFLEAASLLGAFAALRPEAAAGVRTVALCVGSQALGPELSLLLAPFCNLQVRRISHARGHEPGPAGPTGPAPTMSVLYARVTALCNGGCPAVRSQWSALCNCTPPPPHHTCWKLGCSH